MRGEPSPAKPAAAAAVAHALQQHCDSTNDARRARGRKAAHNSSSVDDEAIARLTSQAAGQQSLLLGRLVSCDPTKKARAVERPAPSTAGESPVVTISAPLGDNGDAAHVRRPRPRDGRVKAPITVEEFDEKYATNDPMLHYLIDVVRNGESVGRAEIPRRPVRLIDAQQRLEMPEEDVLFLTYHRRPPCGFRNVYWLEFITEDRAIDIEFEYFALSHHGFTHYRGSSVIDFVDVESWIAEKRAFDHMTAMRGLQKLQGLLFFMSWKKKAIRMKHRRVRDRLACSLFQCDPAAASLLIAIRGCCVTIEELATTNPLPLGSTYMLDHIRQHNRTRLKFVRLEIIKQGNKMCELIESEIKKLRLQRDAEMDAERQNYSSVSRSSRLLDRLYVFLRLIDLHRFESLSTHLSKFMSEVHTQICGDDPTSQNRTNEGPDSREGHHIEINHDSAPPSYVSSIRLPVVKPACASTAQYKTVFSLRHRAIPSPFIFGQVIENIDLGSNASDTRLHVWPTCNEVFEAVHTLLNGYVTTLDGIPPLLSDRRFFSVLAPYTPENRDKFIGNLLKPSSQILEDRAKDMKQMKSAIETYYKQLEILETDRLLLVDRIRMAEQYELDKKQSNEMSGTIVSSLLTALQYEEVRDTWGKLLTEIQELPRFVQIGMILVDQSALLDRLEEYVFRRIHTMMDALPDVYKQCLCDILADADGRIERIMNIPISIPDAIQWLKAVMEMMPTHAKRKAFDAKCANLVRLKQLLKDSGALFRNVEDQEFVKKKDYEWESMFETLMTCFVRVQERDSEHRRSVLELNAKVDESTATQLEFIKLDFAKLPPHTEELLLSKHKTKELSAKKHMLIDRLERLVSVDGEREEMLELYAAFEAEQRICAEQISFESVESSRPSQKWVTKSPSELLLQHVSVVFDMRSWFCAWIGLEDKWADTPLVNLHPSMLLSRLKQFRRRLQFASTRLLSKANASSDDEAFLSRDYALVQALEARVDEVANNYVIIQAATCGSFSSDRWRVWKGSLGLDSVELNAVTLRMVKARSLSAPHSIDEFKRFCEVVVVESKFRNASERLRQRMLSCQVVVWFTNTTVLLENIQDVVLTLDDIDLEAKLLNQVQNPSLEVALALHEDIQAKLALCSRLLSFQGVWNDLCRLSKLHDIDEFFTGQVAWKGPLQRQKKKIGRDESAWGDFIEVGQDWAERLRRLACMSQTSSSQVQAQPKSRDSALVPIKLACTLDEVEEVFNGFDFHVSIAKCEIAHHLVGKYLAMLREKCPRLYFLSNYQLIQLMVYDDDTSTIRRALSICFPCVSQFKLSHGRGEEENTLQDINGVRLSRGNPSETAGALVVKGFRSGVVLQDFNVPVVKVGRLWFWLMRLEEEMGSAVTENAKQATGAAFRLTSMENSFDASYYQEHLPQSVHLALSLAFTSNVEHVLWGSGSVMAGTLSNSSPLYKRSFELRDTYKKILSTVVEFAASNGDLRFDPRLDSLINHLHYQCEILEQMHTSLEAGRSEEAAFLWETQLKIDFVVEDLGAKTARRIRVCDRRFWSECVALGPAFPVTFVAACGQTKFYVGQEMTGMHRLPVITALTQRCYFEIIRAFRNSQISLLAPINTAGRGGQRTIIQGIAQMLMKPVQEVIVTSGSVTFDSWTNLLKSVAAMGCFLLIPRITQLDVTSIRIIAENINQLRQDIRRGFSLGLPVISECRAPLASAPTGCVFASFDHYKSREEGTCTARQLLFGSTVDAFHPVAVSLPSVAYFTRVMALLAGYRPAEIPLLKSAVTFFESLSRLDTELAQASSRIYRLISQVMHDVSLFRHSCRVLLPSNTKWSKKFTGAVSGRPGPRQVSKFFRRSADARDSTDVVIDTLFHHTITVRYKGFLDTQATVEGNISDRVSELADQCFPFAKGCEITDRATGKQEQALWDAMEMSMTQAGLIPSGELLKHALDLYETLQTRSTVIVVGPPGVGKSTCIRTLHRAMQALQVAELAAIDTTGDPNQADGERHLTELVCVSSRFLPPHFDASDEQTKRRLHDLLGTDGAGVSTLPRRWVCVDGVICASRAESFLHSKVMSDSLSASSSHFGKADLRIIFEATSLDHASPSFIVQTRTLHISQTLTPEDILASWREGWTKRLPFPEESRGYENIQVVFRMTELFISRSVRQFVIAEETPSTHHHKSGATQEKGFWPTHLGMLSLNHLTQSCLQLIASACLFHRSQLEERSTAQLTRIVAFCVIWGYAGHLGELYRQKLDQLLSPLVKQLTDTRQVNESPEGLDDSERLGDGFWESIHLPLRGVSPPEVVVKGQTKSFISRVIVNANRVLVVSSATLPLVRVLRLLIHSTASFILVGARGCGKSSLLRALVAMNAEDQAAESLVDVSLDDRFAPNILDWLDKPRTWFNRPATAPSKTSQFRSKAADEVHLFQAFSASAARFVFIDDLAMTKPGSVQTPESDSVDEFVRITLDHKMAINWTTGRVLQLSKEFAASMTTRQPGIPKVRAPQHTERLLRHFTVFRMPHQDRQHLQGIFRHIYAHCFVIPTAPAPVHSATPSVQTRSSTGSERALSLPEVVLRASVDFAVDVLTVQQTTERLELVEGFTFNLHHLNELLSRSLSFSQFLSTSNDNSADTTGGATLLSLGKLHQCWSSSVRSVFLSACHHRVPDLVGDDQSTALATDEVKKVSQSVKLASEKYFSVPAREDPHAALVTDIVYGAYRYLVDLPTTSNVARVKLQELLTANATASSSSTTRRNGISEAGGAASSGTVMARDEFSVRVARELIFERARHLLSDSTESALPIGCTSRLALRLHIGSSAGLHQLLHIIHAIRLSTGVLTDQPLSSTLHSVFRLAYAMEEFEVIELDGRYESQAQSIRAKLEDTLLSSVAHGKRVVVKIDLGANGDLHVITDMIVAVSTGKVPPLLYESEVLRDEAVISCVRAQHELRLLTSDDAVEHFQLKLRQNFRLWVVSEQRTADGFLELMRSSAAFQWLSFQDEDVNNPRYRGEVVRQAIQELTGQTQSTLSRQVMMPTSSDIRHATSWTIFHSICDALFNPDTQQRSEDSFLTFVGNVVSECARRIGGLGMRVNDTGRLVQALQTINDRIPRLQAQSQLLSARIEVLQSWHDELQQPLLDLQTQLRDRVAFLQEQEAELPGDELRALQRKVLKLETRVWAHRSTMDEYNLAKAEVATRLAEIDTELSHWAKYQPVRDSIETRSKAHLAECEQTQSAPERLLKLSADANSVLLGCSETEQPYRDPKREDGPPTVGEALDPFVSQLWRSRFSFLRQDPRSEQILSVVDNLHGRIPLIIDRTSLFQYVLVHIFSNIPWFSDGNEDYDRRDAIGYTVTGAVAPMVVQCDGSPKMWRKLQEAMQKETPTLLVGVSLALIEPLSRFAEQHAQKPRARLLAELTQEAYRAQLKRDIHTPKPLPHSTDLAESATTKHTLDKTASRRQGLASTDLRTISAVLASAGAARRGSTGDPKGALARRLSLTQGGTTVAAPRTFGFQLYAVTEHAIDRAVLEKTGQFAGIEVEWDPCSSASFFAESTMRWYDKKLSKDLVDTRRVEGDYTYRVMQAEAAVWPIVRSPTSTSLSERHEFMTRLEELDLEVQRSDTQIARVPARLAVLESRLKDFEVFGRNMVLAVGVMDTFARYVAPDNSMFVRSHRHFEQLLDTTVAFLLKHKKDSSVQQPCRDWVARVSDQVLKQVISSILASLSSVSHQRIFQMILAHRFSTPSGGERERASTDTSLHRRTYSMPTSLAWLLWGNSPGWSTTNQGVISAQNVPPSAAIDESTNVQRAGDTTLASGAVTSSAPSSSLSIVERLRRKVRVCSLMFDHIEKTRKKGDLQAAASGGKIKSKTSSVDLQGELKIKTDTSADQPTLLDTAHKNFRGVTRIVRTLWCEWKLAKEDQHATVSREIVLALGNQTAHPNRGGLRRRHHSVKDMTLASTNVTQVVYLDDLVGQYLGIEDYCDSKSFEERIIGVVLAKAYFPQQLHTEWDKCLAALGVHQYGADLSTSQLLRIDSSSQTGQARDTGTDAPSISAQLAVQQLPPSIDVAWRRDELVHLPTRVLVYEPSEDRTTLEVLLLRAREPTHTSPMRLFTVIAWEECASRLEEQLTASVTSKERFAVEISHQDHFSSVVGLVSAIVNQHALLCIPEWYVITTIQIFEHVQSPEMGFLRVHVVKKSTETVRTHVRLAQWLAQSVGIAEPDARTAASAFLRQASIRHEDSSPPTPLCASIDNIVAKVKMIAQPGDTASRQRQAKQLLLRELGLDREEQPTQRSADGRSVCVRATRASLEFIGDLFLLRPQRDSSTPTKLDNGITSPTNQSGLPPAISELATLLETLCEVLSHDTNPTPIPSNGIGNDATWQLWRALIADEHEETIRRTRALVQLLTTDAHANSDRNSARQRALIQQGIVPLGWLTQHFPELSDECLSNVVSLAQVLVLIVSRLGFLLHDRSYNSLPTLNVSLLNSPHSVLTRLHKAFATQVGCDLTDVAFVLQPSVAQAEQTESNGAGAAVIQRGRRNSQPFPRGLDQVDRQNSSGIAESQAVSTCLVIGADGLVCGIQIDGLVAVERVTSQNGGGTPQVFIHGLPSCRLVCQHRQVASTDRITTRDSTSSENVTTARLKHEGTRLTTIASTSMFQTLPDSFWMPVEKRAPDSDTLLDRVMFTQCLLISVPSLARTRPEQDTFSIVLAVPVFQADDDDQDT